MKKWLLLLGFFLLPALACAQSVQISDRTTLSFDIPAGWESAREPPANLVEELARHIAHEAAEKGHSPDKEQLLRTARKRFSANEALLFNPISKSYMLLDLSRLRQGERAPDETTIRLSAKYAGESLDHEEGVSKFSSASREATIAGGSYSYRYDADYLQHGKPMHFSGIIGFASPYWYFFYFTDYLGDPEDRNRAEQVFRSLKISTMR